MCVLLGEPVRGGERGGHAEQGAGDAQGRAPAQDVPGFYNIGKIV